MFSAEHCRVLLLECTSPEIWETRTSRFSSVLTKGNSLLCVGRSWTTRIVNHLESLRRRLWMRILSSSYHVATSLQPRSWMNTWGLKNTTGEAGMESRCNILYFCIVLLELLFESGVYYFQLRNACLGKTHDEGSGLMRHGNFNISSLQAQDPLAIRRWSR